MMLKYYKLGIVNILCGSLIACSLFCSARNNHNAPPVVLQQPIQSAEKNYFHYLGQYNDEHKPEAVIDISFKNLVSSADKSKAIVTEQGRTSCFLGEDNKFCELNFEVTETGVYSLYFDYFPLKGTTKDIEFSFFLNGALPFGEAETFTLARMWEDSFDVGKQSDTNGNDVRPIQIEKQIWISAPIYNMTGMYDEPYLFYLMSGLFLASIIPSGAELNFPSTPAPLLGFHG